LHAPYLELLARSDSLGDEGFHQIFEALFRFIRIERPAYVSSSKSSKSSNAANRLRDCATVFRLAVELGVHKITSKTSNAVIDHVVDTLPVAGEAYCQPLIDDYLKILRAVLEQAAHVEHLRDRKWRALADFLIQGISHYALDEENPSSGTNASTLSQHSRNGRVTSFRISQSSGPRTARYEAGRPAEDLFFCLDRLTLATNAPTMSRAAPIMECMTRFFSSTSSSGLLHQLAFSCVNNLTAKMVTEDSRLAQKVVLDIIPTIRRLWTSKNLLVRDEMLITLMLNEDIIKAFPKTNPSDDVHSSLSNLLEVMSTEYSRRNEKDILQLDEILFIKDQAQQVMSLDEFCIRTENIRGTFNWATISVLAFLTLTVDRFSNITPKGKAVDTASKRRKLTNRVDDIFRQSLATPASAKSRALQIIPFVLKDSADVSEKFLNLIAQFTNQILDEDPTSAAWTMIAIARQVGFL
jgi:serine-protein kinase ATM